MIERQHLPQRRTSRRRVAERCFGNTKPAVAVARLRRWIAGDPEMLSELRKAGYRNGSHYFSPREMEVLKRYLL